MKKFYSLIAAGFIGSLVSASAFNGKPWNASVKNPETLPLHAAPTVKVENAGRDVIKGVKDVASRDDEGIDITQFTQMLGYDYFSNWSDENGNEVENFRLILTGCHTDVVYNDPTDAAPNGSFTIMNYSGIDGANVQMNITEEGGLEIPLGQLVGSTSSYNLYFVAMLPDYDENGEPIRNEEGQIVIELVDEGALPMDIYTNAFCTSEYVGVYAREKLTNKGAGFYVLYTFNNFMMPNATLSFDCYSENEDGSIATEHVDNRVYTEFNMVEDDPDVLAEFMISNVMKFNYGTAVNFQYWDLGEEYLIIAPMEVAYFSERVSQTEYTGDFVMAYTTADALGGDVLASELAGDAGEPGYSFTFPTEDAELGITGVEGWMVLAPNTGYWFRYECGPAVLTVDGEPGGTGISGIVSDTNAPATYYNLQGMQISNPTPGQIYIVKKGNSVSKHIIK